MEVTREELLRNGILRRGLLGNKVSGNSAADQMKEIQEGMLSPKTPQQNLELGETYAKPRPFTPDARYYPNVSVPDRLDFVPGNTFPSPAQAYMAEVAAARAAEEAKSGPGPTTDPYAALRAGLGAGEDVARDKEEAGSLSGLLGNFDWRKVIAILARPEFQQPGVSPLTAFTNATFAQGQAEIAGATAKQARMDKFALERIKNAPDAPGAPKITAESVKLYDRINTSRANASLVQKMKMALTGSPSTGAIGTGEQALVAMLNALNIPIGTSASKDYNKLVDQLKTGLLRSGRLLKADYELLESRLPKSGTWQNKEELLNSLRDIEDSSNRQLYEDQQILKTFGLPAGSGAQPASMIRSRNK